MYQAFILVVSIGLASFLVRGVSGGGQSFSCPQMDSGQEIGTAPAILIEASGIVMSRQHPGVLYSHNDGDNDPNLYVLSLSGDELLTINFDVGNPDFEDIAIGRGPDPSKQYIYLADIGDNGHSGEVYRIYRIEEPSAEQIASGGMLFFDSDDYDLIPFSYDLGLTGINSETLMVDDATGDLVVVAKGAPGVFILPFPQSTSQVNLAEFSGLLGGHSISATGGEISPNNGRYVLIREHNEAYAWYRPPGVSLGEALAANPCSLPVEDNGPQPAEAIGFYYNSVGQLAGYVTIYEGHDVPITLFSVLSAGGAGNR